MVITTFKRKIVENKNNGQKTFTVPSAMRDFYETGKSYIIEITEE